MTKKLLLILGFTALSTSAFPIPPHSPADQPRSLAEAQTGNNSLNLISGRHCGGPLAEARIRATTLPLKISIAPEKITAFLGLASRAKVEELRMALGPVSDEERKLMVIAGKFPPFSVTRTPFEELRSILSSGVILSPAEAARKGAVLDRPFTPQLEDALFGGFDCIFALVGPREGRKRYGDVAFILNDDSLKKTAWATFSSGWHFMKTTKSAGTAPGQEDKLGYSETVFTAGEWGDVFPPAIVAYLREKPEKESIWIKPLLKASKDRVEFQGLVDKFMLGYMEAKIPREFPLENVDSIEVPLDKLKEVLEWPESKKWASKITGVVPEESK